MEFHCIHYHAIHENGNGHFILFLFIFSFHFIPATKHDLNVIMESYWPFDLVTSCCENKCKISNIVYGCSNSCGILMLSRMGSLFALQDLANIVAWIK